MKRILSIFILFLTAISWAAFPPPVIRSKWTTNALADGATGTNLTLYGAFTGNGGGLTNIPTGTTNDFNTTQFINAGTGTIKSGATLTNPAINGTVVIDTNMVFKLHNQNTLFGSMSIGNGMSNLTHTSGEQGRYNTAFGIDALTNITTAYFCTAIGYGALGNNISGEYQVAVGQGALRNNLTGVENTAVGVSTLYDGIDIIQNSAFGLDALWHLVTGRENTAIGKRALWVLTNANYNTSLGADSSYSLLTGSYNTSIGWGSLYAVVNDQFNTAVGAQSGMSLIDGDNNSLLGRASFLNLTNGSLNVAIGAESGRYETDGATGLKNASASVYVGYNAMGTDSAGNEIVIGASAKGSGNNSAVIGNDSVTKTLLKGNVGLGVTAPSEKLQVAGNASITGTNYVGALQVTNTVSLSITSGGSVTLGNHHTYLANTNLTTVTLPTAVGKSGVIYTVKAINPAVSVTITNATGAQTIDGALSYSLTASNKFVKVQSDNANWWVIGGN